jgi:hypothetical protein
VDVFLRPVPLAKRLVSLVVGAAVLNAGLFMSAFDALATMPELTGRPSKISQASCRIWAESQDE